MCDEELDSKDILERRKLAKEIEALDSPLWRSPALWLSMITTFIAVCAFVVQVFISSRESSLAKRELDLTKKELTMAKEEVELDLKNLESEKKKTEESILIYQGTLEEIMKVMARSPNAVSKEVQKEILGLLPFETRKKFYDPTGEFPYHLSPQE